MFQHEQFRKKHQDNPVLLKELATMLATIHHLDVPLVKSANLMLQDFVNNINIGYDELNVQEIIEECQLENLLKKSLKVAMAELLEYVRQMNCPVSII